MTAANGKKVLALAVFAHALRFFKEHCLQELSDQSSTRIVNDDIRWVITVPAIWRQPAKQFMRQSSYDVRIANLFIITWSFVCFSVAGWPGHASEPQPAHNSTGTRSSFDLLSEVETTRANA